MGKLFTRIFLPFPLLNSGTVGGVVLVVDRWLAKLLSKKVDAGSASDERDASDFSVDWDCDPAKVCACLRAIAISYASGSGTKRLFGIKGDSRNLGSVIDARPS